MRVIYRDKVWDLKGSITVREAIKKVGLDPQSVLATRNDKLINQETVLSDDDTIKLIAVISGGLG
ncbi:MAG: MoaD/ThiS family protein [Anaerolineae bacterium]